MEAVVGSLVVLLLLWLGVALGCAFGAKSILLGKGRSGRAGFWLGFCLGLTGLLIAALLSSTPEHEARKMQLQMQMMGIAPPPPGAPHAGAGTPTALVAPITATPPTDLPSVIIALVVSAVYALGSLALRNYPFKDVFGPKETLALLVFSVGVALAVAALVKKTSLLVGLASGVALGLCGLGLASLGDIVGDWYVGQKVLFVLPVDIAAFVGAALVAVRSVAGPPAVAWWKQVAMGLGGAGVLLTLAASQPFGIGGVVGNVAIWGGFVIAAMCLLKAGRTSLALAIGWSATTVVYLIGTEFKGVSYQASTTLQQLVMLLAGGIGGVALWALRQAEPDEPAALAATDSQVLPPSFAAAPAAFAVAPSGFAPASPPIAVPPASPMPPQPMDAPPALLTPPPPVANLAGPSPETTMPRPRLAQVTPVRLLFATGESVALHGALVLGRAPVAPDKARTALSFVVADSSFTISSTHCLLSLEDGEVWVEDLGSTNGTDVVSPTGTTELALGQRVRLTAVDRVQLGDNWCRIES